MRRIRIGINGFGRIGRTVARQMLACEELELVGIADVIDDIENLAYLYNYDSNFGRADRVATVSPDGRQLDFGQGAIAVSCESRISDVAWGDAGADIVIDASGVGTNVAAAPEVLRGGVGHVVVTGLNAGSVDKTIILGVNDAELDPAQHRIISSSTCDANAIAHILKGVDDRFGIVNGFVTTLHPWLSYQNLVDGPVRGQADPQRFWSDYSLGRASDGAIIPKGTTAISALSPVLPAIVRKCSGFSYRVPTALVCSADITVLLEQEVDASALKAFFRELSSRSRYVHVNAAPLISKDYRACTESVVVDLQWTMVEGRVAKIVGWYDNEWGYGARVLDLCLLLGEAAR